MRLYEEYEVYNSYFKVESKTNVRAKMIFFLEKEKLSVKNL